MGTAKGFTSIIMHMLGVITLFTIFSIFYYNFHVNRWSSIEPDDSPVNLTFEEIGNIAGRGYAISTSGCRIQDFDPYDKLIVDLLDPLTNLECSDLPSLVAVDNEYTLKIDNKAIPFFGGQLEYCLYIPIYRHRNGLSDNDYIFGQQKMFTDKIEVEDEFVKIECYNEKKMIHQDFFPFIQKNIKAERRCESIRAKRKDKTDDVSIAIIGTDSVSRLNFIRFCPKSRDFLLNEMKAIELRGYNKVGDHTFHNLLPMLLGKYVWEFKWSDNQPFDNFTFIWKEFASKGYITAFAEDDPEVSLFNYEKAGFFYPPADFYLRPFYVAYANSRLYSKDENACLGNRFNSEVILDYAYNFLKTYKNQPYFAFFYMSSLTHAAIDQLKYADDLYQDFLAKIHNERLLRKTILIFMSDHGIRFGKFRGSYIGRLEERLPLFHIVFPNWFKRKYPEIVKTVMKNSYKLTTPFDVYATLKDLLHFTGKRKKRTPSPIKNRGISLFNDIPEERTCKAATILPHWCTCQENHRIKTNHLAVKMAAAIIINEINKLTEDYRDICKQVSLNKILDASFSLANVKFLKYRQLIVGENEKVIYHNKGVHAIRDVTVTVTTTENKAEFEGTVRITEHPFSLHITGDISRINEYGNQSHCIHNYEMKKFCICFDV